MKAQAIAKLKRLRMSPRKVRLLVDQIRRQSVTSAQQALKGSTKDAALPVKKLLDSAVANAVHNHQMIADSLVVKEAYVDEGATLYRWMPRAFGRASKIRKRTSHITIVIEGDVPTATEKKVTEKKEEKKIESKKTNKAGGSF